MYGQVMSKSKSLFKLSKDIVFILGHMQDTKEAMHKTWVQYMPHKFYTPTYIFLDSYSNPLFQEVTNKYMHRMISEKLLVSTLETHLKSHGKGLPHKKWKEIKDRFNKAEQAVKDGDLEAGAEILGSIVKEKPSPVLTERANRKRNEILDVIFLAKLKESLTIDPNDEAMGVYRKALTLACERKFISAQNLCASLIVEERDSQIAELHKRMNVHVENAVTGGRIIPRKVPVYGLKEPYWEAVLIFGSKLPIVEEMTVQYFVLTERGNIFAGYQTLKNVEPHFRHVISAYLPCTELEREEKPTGQLEYEKITDLRYEIYLFNEMVASRNYIEKPKSEWWKETKVKNLIFLTNPGWGWDSGIRMTRSTEGALFKRPKMIIEKD